MTRTSPYLNNIAYYLLLVYSFVLMLSIQLAEFMAVLMLVIWLAQTLVYRRKDWLGYPLFLPIMALLLFNILVLLASGHKGGFGRVIEQLTLPLIYFIAPSIVVNSERRARVVWVVIAGACLAAGIGVIRYLAGDVARAATFTSGCTTLAYFLAVAIAMALAIFVYSEKSSEKVFLGLVMLPLALGLILTLTRAGYLAAGLSLVILGLFKERKLLLVGVVIAAAFCLAMPSTRDKIAQRLDVTNTRSFLSHRDILLSLGIDRAQNVPFFGYGLNSFTKLVDVEAEDRIWDKGIMEWHNMYVKALLDGGPLGLVILIWIIAAQTRFSLTRFRKTKSKDQKAFQLGVLLLLMSLVVIGLFDTVVTIRIMAMLSWLFLGMSII
jgi:hypothetical protein